MGFRSLRLGKFCAVVAVMALAGCSKAPSPVNPSPAGPTRVVTHGTGAPVGLLVGAGDIGFCGPPGASGAEATGRLLDRLEGTVFTAGDNAYASGSAEDFRRCYEPAWGRHRARTRPAPGNHEYNSGGGPYFDYFGANAGPVPAGYYSYDLGPWRIISLNSEVSSGPGSAQGDWLRQELSSNPSTCTAVYWHRPLFSSGSHGDNPDMRELWRTLYASNVDVVINGHDHIYERFAPQDPDGRFEPARGIREFIVGTGGASLYGFPSAHANSEIRAAVWGVAVFTLFDGGYRWEFTPVEGQTFQDSGSAVCH